LLALCGVYSGGLASASPVGRFGLAIPLGRDKRIARRALSLFTMLYSPKVFNALQLSFPYLAFYVFRSSRLQQVKSKDTRENFPGFLLQPDVFCFFKEKVRKEKMLELGKGRGIIISK